ncbi:MAG: hypothetical protein KIT88_10165 [Phycisphaeraceae bacterium]|nr:hypothetical protein [Phycisphaeraceae bacterium]
MATISARLGFCNLEGEEVWHRVARFPFDSNASLRVWTNLKYDAMRPSSTETVHKLNPAACQLLARGLPATSTKLLLKNLRDSQVVTNKAPSIQRINSNLNTEVEGVLTRMTALVYRIKILDSESSLPPDCDFGSLAHAVETA